MTKKDSPQKKRRKKVINRIGSRLTILDADGNLVEYRSAVVPREDEENEKEREEEEE